MQFEIRLESVRGQLIDIDDSHAVGIKMVDQIRKEAGCDLPLARINGYVEGVRNYIRDIPIYEDIARKSGHFAERGIVKIMVSNPDGMRRFFKLSPIIERKPDTGEVMSAKCIWVLDKGAIVSEWEAAGFPLEWTLPDENQEKQE